MVDDINAHHHAGAHHAIGQEQIVLAGRRVPDGWLWKSTMAAAAAAAASRNTSRGCTTAESTVPVATIRI